MKTLFMLTIVAVVFYLLGRCEAMKEIADQYGLELHPTDADRMIKGDKE